MRPVPLPALAVALPLLLASCRDFQVPPEYHGPVPLGVGCTESAECVTDLCADGVCCEKACAEDELCNVKGREGRCAPRPPGTPCSRAAQCPGGRCLHTATSSYCFEDGCAADERFDIPGHEGTCTPRPPGSPCDASEQCPGGRCFHPAGGGAPFCCDRDCATDESCEVPGHEGTCTERPPGTPCTEAQQCPTGLCVAGEGGKLCCEKACAAAERCDAPGHEGACTPRALGDACQAGADCPLGHCVQGVCCESACKDDCKSCAMAGSRGLCKDVEENTDPRGRCGFCGACTRGFCGAALANTAPKDDCGKGTGMVCSVSQTCGLKTGSPCAQDADCAAGVCALSKCLLAETSFVYPQPLEPPVSEVGLAGVAVDASGLLGVEVASLHEYRNPAGVLIPDYNQYTTMVRDGGAWERALHVNQDCDQSCSRMAGDLTFWGGRLYQVQYQPCTAATGCGLVGQLFGSELQAGDREQIGPPDAFVTSAFVSTDASQRLWAAFADHAVSPALIRVALRSPRQSGSPEWVEQWTTPDPSWTTRTKWGAAVVGDEVYVAMLVEDPEKGPSFAVVKSPGDLAALRAIPGACMLDSVGTGLSVGSFGHGGDQGISMAANCVDGTYVATWTPAAPEPWWISDAVQTEVAAIPVRNAEVPAFVVFRSGRISDLTLWWKGPAGAFTFAETPAFVSSFGAAAFSAQATAGDDGAPVIAVTLFEYWKSPTGMPTSVQVVRYHR